MPCSSTCALRNKLRIANLVQIVNSRAQLQQLFHNEFPGESFIAGLACVQHKNYSLLNFQRGIIVIIIDNAVECGILNADLTAYKAITPLIELGYASCKVLQ